MTKAVIFDTDGMLVISEVFSVQYCKEFGISYDLVLPFFKNEFQKCLVGKADLKEQIQPYLALWRWKNSVDSFMDYWFKAEHTIDHRLVSVIKRLRDSGIKCYLATNQEKYRTEYLKIKMGFGRIFDRIFSSAEVGYKKPQPEFFSTIMSEIGFPKNEIQFWDDTEKNVLGARDFGLDAKHYHRFKEFEAETACLLR